MGGSSYKDAPLLIVVAAQPHTLLPSLPASYSLHYPIKHVILMSFTALALCEDGETSKKKLLLFSVWVTKRKKSYKRGFYVLSGKKS